MTPLETVPEFFLNLVAVLFWFAFWNPDSRDIFFNPYVLKIRSLADNLIDPVKPLVGRHITRRGLAGLMLLAVLLLKGFLYYLGLRGQLSFGIDSTHPDIAYRVLTPYAPTMTDADLAFAPTGIFIAKIMLFSCATFAVFIFKIWSVALLYLGTRRATGLSRAEGTLFSLARPMMSITPELRPFFLLALGVGIVSARALFFRGVFPFDWDHCLLFMTKAFLSTLAAWVEVLHHIIGILGVLILGSWLALFTMTPTFGLMCREGLDLFIGPFRHHPFRIGIMDLSPILVVVILVTVARTLQLFILKSYTMLL